MSAAALSQFADVPKAPRELLPCGSDAAYARHRRRGEAPCRPCLDAHNERTRAVKEAARRERGAPLAPWANSQVMPCGTSAAFQRHRRHGETPCEPCRRAWSEAKAKTRHVAKERASKARVQVARRAA